ncbi:hypothetical protein NDU88_003435 [Pleurodeles waltl]|uniref:Uncharacterized protein n=1 Tax=Pleurodeles waltl TaxID=8319 RepID=A0AAV7SFT3_PLEWA|nr:hypothetical protein NDU88_003435 [Pleurodeles waltl]
MYSSEVRRRAQKRFRWVGEGHRKIARKARRGAGGKVQAERREEAEERHKRMVGGMQEERSVEGGTGNTQKNVQWRCARNAGEVRDRRSRRDSRGMQERCARKVAGEVREGGSRRDARGMQERCARKVAGEVREGGSRRDARGMQERCARKVAGEVREGGSRRDARGMQERRAREAGEVREGGSRRDDRGMQDKSESDAGEVREWFGVQTRRSACSIVTAQWTGDDRAQKRRRSSTGG